MSDDLPKFDNENIKNLVKGIYLIFLSGKPNTTTNLYVLVRQLAKTYDEIALREELFDIWNGTLTKIPVPSMEIIIEREMARTNFVMTKPYNFKGKRYFLSDVSILLQSCKESIMDIFFDICKKHDIEVKFDFGFDKENAGVLPQL